jgi:hypothetical protein
MSNRDTFNASVKTAAVAAQATGVTNAITQQTTISAKCADVGYNLQTGNYANLAAAVANANKAAVAAGLLAEMTKQMAIHAAKDTLRSTGDLGPV